MNRPYQPAPSNYFVVPQLGDQKPARAPEHYSYTATRRSGRLDLDLVVVGEALHVGTGLWGGEPGKLHKEFAIYRGKPGIPGSGIKGSIRMIAEALTASCLVHGQGSCKFQNLKSDLCFACRVFGTLGYLGRIGFDQAVLDSGSGAQGTVKIPLGFQPKDARNVGRRFYGRKPAGTQDKLPCAALKKGCRLRTALFFEEIEERDLGVVFLAMGLDGSFRPKIGGGKYAGLGAVRFEPLGLALTGASAYRRGAEPDPTAPDFVQSCLGLAASGLPKSGLEALARLRKELSVQEK